MHSLIVNFNLCRQLPVHVLHVIVIVVMITFVLRRTMGYK